MFCLYFLELLILTIRLLPAISDNLVFIFYVVIAFIIVMIINCFKDIGFNHYFVIIVRDLLMEKDHVKISVDDFNEMRKFYKKG